MRYLTISVLIIAVSFPLHAQDSQRYASLINEARSLYEGEQFQEAALIYEEAFSVVNGSGRLVDHFNAACAWSLAGAADQAFSHLEFLAANTLFTRLDWILNNEDLRMIHNDLRWTTIVDSVRTNAERAEASRTHVGSFHYTRMMLLFNANAEALNRRLPAGWVVSNEGTNIVIGFCNVWGGHDPDGRLVSDSDVKYIPLNDNAWNMATGEWVNVRYTEYADYPHRLITADPKDVEVGNVVPSRIIRESRIEYSESLGDIYHEYWRVEVEGGGLMELRASFTHRISWSTSTSAMDVVYASNPARRLHYRNEEMHNIITRLGEQNHLVDFELKIDLPGWHDVFDGTEQLLSVRFIPTSKRDVFVYDQK